MRILVTGAGGLVGHYLLLELLACGHQVIGLDNLSKYGGMVQSALRHPNFTFVEGDAKDVVLMKRLASECEQIVALAACVGGVRFLNDRRCDLFMENLRLTAATVEASVWAHRRKQLTRILFVSSSHVYGHTTRRAREGDELRRCPPTAYGLQKLCGESLVREASAQHGLPYTLIRPFNCVGGMEQDLVAIARACNRRGGAQGGHVLIDLATRIRAGHYPLPIMGGGRQIRDYIHGKDLARGIRLCMESKSAMNNDFNITSESKTSVLNVARLLWKELSGRPWRFRAAPAWKSDIETNIGSGAKARRILGFAPRTKLEMAIKEYARGPSLLQHGSRRKHDQPGDVTLGFMSGGPT